MSTKTDAEKRIRAYLVTDFKYIYKETNVGRHKIHLTFKMDSSTYDLQMTFDFEDSYCDILTFISPRVLTAEYYDETLHTINEINTYVKAFGRFYVDEYNDVAYSLRLPYSMIENQPVHMMNEIEGAVAYFEDLFCVLLDVTQGKRSFEECKIFLQNMWG